MAKDIRTGAWVPPPDGPVENMFIDGTKLVLTWTSQGRGVVLAVDASAAAYEAYSKGDFSKAFTTAASVIHEKVFRNVAATSRTTDFAERAAGYWGFIVDKVVGAAAEAAAVFKTRPATCEAGKKC